MALALSNLTRHKTFVSYHHADEAEVSRFIDEFDHGHNVLISRGIGASMPGDVINSNNDDYIKRRIREQYLVDSTVTLVLVGANTWGRRFVDWEVAASLRNTSTTSRNGLLAITLPSVAQRVDRRIPARVQDNVTGDSGYARWMRYPNSAESLAFMIDEAFDRRTSRSHLAVNSRPLMSRNAPGSS